ncbi:hypothetical protein AB0J83_29590 [Actinoplanes sp. NPDC049596]|uniref:hypothetical protein n=1 Tax=unclassified Actinoplanes TaxID=2626549 RepID=UPI003419A591
MFPELGTDRRWVLDGGFQPTHPRWSPDGTEIGFEAGDIVAAKVAELAWRPVFTAGLGGSPLTFDWSPDGRRVAVVRTWVEDGDLGPVYGRDIWIGSADGSTVLRRLTDPGTGWDPYRIAWSPDGRTLAVEALGDLWAVDVRSGAVINLTATAGVAESSPIWSPDGHTLAFARQGADDAAPRLWLRPARSHGDAGRRLGIAGIPTSWH